MSGVSLSVHKASAVPGAVIFGCAGYELTADERAFFADADPLGFILFARNVRAPEQVKALIADFRNIVGRPDAPVLIDQEGGRVARLRPPHWRLPPPAARIGKLSQRNIDEACEAARLNSRLIAAELLGLGINVDCAPVCDVPVPGSHDIIGDRAYSTDPALAGRIARAAAQGFLEGGVQPIIKHIPGHGRARADSHAELPVVDTARAELERSDFVPFKALADMPWAMTAHVLYTAIDKDNPATTSRKVIVEIIRGHIGFKGVLLSDDLSMQALKGDFGDRTRASLAAGCDVVLHCNGDFAEMKAIAAATPKLDKAALERLARAAAQAKPAANTDTAELSGRLDRLLATA
jgi:beta-N-acetylhexosaminidase